MAPPGWAEPTTIPARTELLNYLYGRVRKLQPDSVHPIKK